MKRVKSGFYNNSESKRTVNILNKTIKKKKKLTQSISERCVYTNTKKENINNLLSKNNSNINDNFKLTKIDIKFNILNNLKNYKTIFNKSSFQKLNKNNQDDANNNNNDSKFKLKLYNHIPNIPKLIINKKITNNFFYDLESEKDDNENITNSKNKQTQLDPHGYFPEDFSLNIYKSTSLYKNRYKIQTCRLKKVLKNIYQEENSKHNKDLNDIIKKNTIENNLSINMFKLLKAQKIDRFVNRLLNINNNPFQSQNENSKDNNNIKLKDNFFLTNKNKLSKKINNFDLDDLYTKNEAYIQPNSNINNEDLINKFFFIRNISLDNNNNNKSNTANSATQTMIVNNELRKNYYYNRNINEFRDKSLRDSQNILNSNNNNLSFKGKNCSCKEIKFEMRQFPKKNIFLKKSEKVIRPFSATKTKSLSSLNIQNNNIINKFNKDKKLIFSFYVPKDKYIQLFEDLEKKEFDSHMNIKINSNIYK